MTAQVIVGDCREVLAAMEPDSVDAVVTDPPYELSSDGKASASRVALELMFPDHAKVKAGMTGKNGLPFLVSQILGLSRVGRLPRPAATVPIGAVALNGDAASGQHDVKHGGVGAVGVSDRDGGQHGEAQPAEHLGDFALKLADPTAMLDALNGAGCGFDAGGIGIGFRVGATGLPRLPAGGGVIDIDNPDVGLADDPLAATVGAFAGTERQTVARLHLGRCAEETLSARAALMLCRVLEAGGAELVRTRTGTGGLPAVLESRRVRIVDDATDRTLTFNLVLHPQSIAGVGFMGKDWDGSKVAFDVATWRAAYRVLKPGGHLLAFGGTRTFHRIAVAIEDAGFEIRDTLSWLYGSGFPKSHDVGKAMDREAGLLSPESVGFTVAGRTDANLPNPQTRDYRRPAMKTDLARQWDGWGTALKPAWEPVIVARKPLAGTVAANVAQHGTGALNIDGCRIAGSVQTAAGRIGFGADRADGYVPGTGRQYGTEGRWPANVCLDADAAALLDEMSGVTASRFRIERNSGRQDESQYRIKPTPGTVKDFGDTGGASRFFYVAKASRSERNAGLDGMPERAKYDSGSEFGKQTMWNGENGDDAWRAKNPNNPQANHHPTVKPIALMRWLVRLVTPPGGTVLDPFTGSGTTGIAAVMEGFRFVGVEQSEEYAEIARKRIAHAQGPLLAAVSA